MSSSKLPVVRLDAPNKHPMREEIPEASDGDVVQNLIEHGDDVFDHFEFYERSSGNSDTGRYVHCIVQRLEAWSGQRAFGKNQGKGHQSLQQRSKRSL